MKIKYTFVDGTKTELEVEEKYANIILTSNRKEEADKGKKHHHKVYSLDAIVYEGTDYAETEPDPPKGLSDEERQYVRNVLSCLTETQQRRLLLLADGKKLREIAELENASIASVHESIESAKKKFEKIYKKHPEKMPDFLRIVKG